ncbi:MAG: hypothetical protein EA420_14270 [Candidatus Competibacteraceae bacterium]|nr:MAG: hypothetical protein EA420_14270 [Candidatus Competibacteraceae bacterium]
MRNRKNPYLKLYQQGQREGETDLLQQLLEYQFGPLPRRVQQRLAEADEAALRAWGLRLPTANTLEEVFPKPPRRQPPT